ncbi:hypothetical protein OKW43_001730 [Paraburkholderia sp. WC7.3g]|uniref:DUF6024 family protein n=1 Tax=Paraburkholderia sp. WC7.3g TaxID=2991070 RepID=UPI003D21EB67
MDSASIAPILHPDPTVNVFRHTKQLRDELRVHLAEIYHLQAFSVHLVPSVRYGLLALKQWIELTGRRVGLRAGSHYAPIAQLFREPISWKHNACDAWITTHVAPYVGTVSRLYRSGSPLEIVDASHSFATNLHAVLLETANVFVAPLHKHAGLTVGLALIAVRRDLAMIPEHDLLDELERATASQAPLIEALNNLERSGACSFNKATPGNVQARLVDASIVCVSDLDFPLPFACFRHRAFPRLSKAALHEAGATYFAEFDVLRIAKWARGTIDDDPVEFTADIHATLVRLTRQ